MELQQKTESFLLHNGFITESVPSLTNILLSDMNVGLKKEYDGTIATAAEPMIVASSNIPKKNPQDETVIVIDAGGTNFRSCLVTFNSEGESSISEFEKTTMPGFDKELSREEFYNQIADNIEHLKDKATRIGFCFSYAMKNTMDGDAQVLRFSKEIKAPQVVGTFVGRSLLEVLQKRGWKNIQKIVILNDTMASLLSGITNSIKGKVYSSYVGFILGTGLNNAYIEYEPIAKFNGFNSSEHIVVCESGMYNRLPQSAFDKDIDSKSVNPGQSTLEKMCSGAYLGKLAESIISYACEAKLFSQNVSRRFKTLENIESKDIDEFLFKPFNVETKLGDVIASGLQSDRDTLYYLLDNIITRAAHIVASVLAASVIKTGKGKLPSQPVCVVCNGTTFWKAHNLVDKVQRLLSEILTENKHIFYELVKVENDVTLGSAVAASL